MLIALVTVAAFLPTLQNQFVDWDDQENLLDNPHYRGLGWTELRWMWTTFHKGHYHPLTWMTFGLDYLLWGLNPLGYHLTALLLHALTAAVFYFVVLRLPWMSAARRRSTHSSRSTLKRLSGSFGPGPLRGRPRPALA